MRQALLPVAAALMAVASIATAQVSAGAATYKCVDTAGRSTYTNVKEEMGGKKCTVVSREISIVNPAPPTPGLVAKPAAIPAPAKPSDSANAKAAPQDAKAQRTRETDRRRILQEELQNADKQLAVARQKLVEQEAVRSGNERNYERVLERLKPFQDDVRVAEENVVALKRELSNLR